MSKITFVAADRQTEQTLDIPEGTSVMRGALSNDVEGIVGQCGGYTQCASCHVYVEPDLAGRLEAIGEEEDAMLDFAACPREPSSRLSCQIIMTDALDGLRVRVPERQG
jgi:2Fe-2S ferredoxin